MRDAVREGHSSVAALLRAHGGTLGMEGALVYTRTHAYLGRRGFDGFNEFDNGGVLHGTQSVDGKDGYGQHTKQFAERWQAVRARVGAARVNGSVLLRPHRLNELCETVNRIEKRSVVYDQQNVVHDELAHALIRLPCHFGHALLELMPRLELLRRALCVVVCEGAPRPAPEEPCGACSPSASCPELGGLGVRPRTWSRPSGQARYDPRLAGTRVCH